MNSKTFGILAVALALVAAVLAVVAIAGGRNHKDCTTVRSGGAGSIYPETSRTVCR